MSSLTKQNNVIFLLKLFIYVIMFCYSFFFFFFFLFTFFHCSTLSLDPDMNPDEEEEKHRLISQVLELQNTLDDLSSRVDSVKEENLKLKSENQVLGQYIENLMAASSVFQSTSPAKAKKKSGAGGNSVTELMAGDK